MVTNIAELNTWWMSGHLFITFQDCPWICVKWLSSLNGERHAMPGYQPLLLFKHPNHVPNWIRRTLCQNFGLFLFTFCKNVLMLSWNLFFGYIQMVYIYYYNIVILREIWGWNQDSKNSLLLVSQLEISFWFFFQPDKQMNIDLNNIGLFFNLHSSLSQVYFKDVVSSFALFHGIWLFISQLF